MNKNAAIKLAIKIIKKHATDYYGWAAKFNTDKKEKYEQLIEVCKILEGLQDE